MTKHSLLEMKKRNYGRILLIASIAGKEVRPAPPHTLTPTHYPLTHTLPPHTLPPTHYPLTLPPHTHTTPHTLPPTHYPHTHYPPHTLPPTHQPLSG